MKKVFELVLLIGAVISAGAGGYLLKGHVDDRPHALTNNTLRWVRDPNLGNLYYGWYEEDGSAFNSVATASRNKRMGETHEKKDVPVHQWVQVN